MLKKKNKEQEDEFEAALEAERDEFKQAWQNEINNRKAAEGQTEADEKRLVSLRRELSEVRAERDKLDSNLLETRISLEACENMRDRYRTALEDASHKLSDGQYHDAEAIISEALGDKSE